MAFQNPSLPEIGALLQRMHTLAVVGLSPLPQRPSHGVARAMQGFGYRIVPVRPAVDSVLGETAYASLAAIPFKVDCVNVFRRAEELEAIVDATLAIGAPVLWIQEGIINVPAAERAVAGGLTVVMNRCIYKDYLSTRVLR